MPALAPVPGVARFAVTGHSGTTNFTNIFHVAMQVSPRPWTLAELQSVMTAIGQSWPLTICPLLYSTYTAQQIVATDLTSETAESAISTITGVGGGTGNSHPYSVAACLSWKVKNRYRGGHPRTYLGPISDAATDKAKSFTGAYISQANQNAADFLGDVNSVNVGGQGVRLCAVARYRNKIQLAEPFTMLIDGVILDSRIDTQRRRLGRDVV